MNKPKILEVIALFGGLAFLVMWVDQFIYKGVSLRDSYFFLMFALAGLLAYVYLRGSRVAKQTPPAKPTPPPRPLQEKKKQKRK